MACYHTFHQDISAADAAVGFTGSTHCWIILGRLYALTTSVAIATYSSETCSSPTFPPGKAAASTRSRCRFLRWVCTHRRGSNRHVV